MHWAFESLAARAESSLDADEAVLASEKALEVYRGTFLPEEADASWAVSTRERLGSRHRKLVLATVERWRGLGSFEAARTTLERAIETDPLEGRFSGELMTEYMRLGREADARAVLGRYRRLLTA
jgi:LuxR family maltose regulon positive regulatory protein